MNSRKNLWYDVTYMVDTKIKNRHMKHLWSISLVVCMVHLGSIQAKELNANRSGVMSVEQAFSKFKADAVLDTSANKIVFLPFNTGKQELSPAVSNGYLYYFGSNEEYLNTRIFKVPIAEIQQSAQKQPKELEVAKSDRHQYTYLNFTSDGKTVLLNAVNRKTGNNNLYIGNADDLATIEKLVPFEYNSKKYSVGRATISPNGQLLVFSSDKSRSMGKLDLWICKLKNGKWQSPENMGSLINTVGNEMMPFFVSNTRLCFASDEHTRYGGFDLYYTCLKGDSFTLPVNMGLSVNGKDNETGICYCPQNGLYYFTSDRRGNNDIYSYNAGTVLSNPENSIAIGNPNDGLDTSKQQSVASENSNVPDSLVVNEPETRQDSVQALGNKAESEEETLLQDSMPANSTTDIDKHPVFEDRVPGQKGYFSVQIMALPPKWYAKGYYRKKLDQSKKYYLVKEDGYVKIRTGNFSSYRMAISYVKDNGIKEFYIVRMTKGQISEYL